MPIVPRTAGPAVAPPYPLPTPSSPPRPRTDAELIAALVPLAEDHIARLVADRERHGPAAAAILAASRLAKYYSWVHLVCEGVVDDARKAGAA